MRHVGGVLGASVGAGSMWLLAGAWATNLPSGPRLVSLALLLLVGVVMGFVAGAAIFSRPKKVREGVALFSGLAAGVGGGIVGAVLALVILAAYVDSYAGWPSNLSDQILMTVAFPVFGALGFWLGACVAGVVGLCVGSLLRIAASRR